MITKLMRILDRLENIWLGLIAGMFPLLCFNAIATIIFTPNNIYMVSTSIILVLGSFLTRRLIKCECEGLMVLERDNSS